MKRNMWCGRDNCNSKPRVLLVEDTPIAQFVGTQFLQTLGCHVVNAESGAQAIEQFKQKVDLVILDFDLPDMSGSEIAKAMRQENINQDVPIICLTARGNMVYEECKAAGMNEIFTKPILFEKFSEILSRWLSEY